MSGSATRQATGCLSKAPPPFLQKLSLICETCPHDIACWSEDGTQFVVTSSQFADVLAQHFKGSQQTFARQLHFYGFSRREFPNNTWSFSHPHFQRGNTNLDMIERKPKATPKSGLAPNSPPSAVTSASADLLLMDEAVEKRFQMLEQHFAEKVSKLEAEIALLHTKIHCTPPPPPPLLMPTSPPSTLTSNSSGLDAIHDEIERHENLNKRLHHSDSASMMSIGDLLDDLDAFFPPEWATNSETCPVSPQNLQKLQQCEGPESEECRKRFVLVADFTFHPGMNPDLLKKTVVVMQQVCCATDSNSQPLFPGLVKMCRECPNPATLPPVEQCPVCISLLPYLREHVDIPGVTDLQLMRASRQLYELCYAKRNKALTVTAATAT